MNNLFFVIIVLKAVSLSVKERLYGQLNRINRLMTEITTFENKVQEKTSTLDQLFVGGENKITTELLKYERNLLENAHDFNKNDLDSLEKMHSKSIRQNMANMVTTTENLKKTQSLPQNRPTDSELDKNPRIITAEQAATIKEKQDTLDAIKKQRKELEDKIRKIAELRIEVRADRNRLSSSMSSILTPNNPSIGVKTKDISGLRENFAKGIKEQLELKNSGHLSVYTEHVNLNNKMRF